MVRPVSFKVILCLISALVSVLLCDPVCISLSAQSVALSLIVLHSPYLFASYFLFFSLSLNYIFA